MKKVNVRKTIVVIALIAIVLLLSSSVYATGTVSPINIISTTQQTNEVKTNQTTNTTTNVVAPTTNTTNTAVSTYTNTNLPQTGDASDYAIFLLIVVSVVIAIFAYKKVRDYNI